MNNAKYRYMLVTVHLFISVYWLFLLKLAYIS